MFVELHMIQNFAPANLNRDDTNNPKDCEFGGVRRARISSQCIKRAIRESDVFEQITQVEPAVRTKWVVRLLCERLGVDDASEADVRAVVEAVVPALLSKLDRDGQRTAVLLYLSASEIDSIASDIEANWQALLDEKTRAAAIKDLTKAWSKAHKGTTSAPDIALFGRMLAEYPQLNLEAACQVAHAISTHRTTMEMDFYTAVDDLNPEDTVGAGMMGFTGFDSACFYRYARIDWKQLVKNLGDVALARRTVEGFLRAAVAALPTGKQNSFAAHNPPSLSLAVVREDGMGWSLANAFERPVSPRRDEGFVAPSAQALDAYWERLTQTYGSATLIRTAALAIDPDLPLQSLASARVADLNAWVAAVLDALPGEEAMG